MYHVPVPADLLTMSVIACEKVLIERDDGVPSLIRLVDIVFINADIPAEKRAPFLINLLVQARFKIGVNRACTVHVDLIRINGERIRMQSQEMPDSASPHREAPGGFNWETQVAIIPANTGTVFIEVSLEDTAVRIPLTFLPAQRPASE